MKLPASKTARPPIRALLLLAFSGLYLLHVTGFGGRMSEQEQNQAAAKPAGRRRRLAETPAVEVPAGPSAVDAAGALAEPPAVHGYVQKAGPTRLEYWTPANRTARHQAFEHWVHDIYENPDTDSAITMQGNLRLRNLPPMYPNCQILVNHRYKFIYVRHPKSASSSITTYFGTCPIPAAGGSGSGGSGSGAAAGQEQQQQQQQQPLGRGAACLEPLAAQEISPEEIHRMWGDYFVFTVVRNPYQRMLSSYKYLLRKTRHNPAGCRKVRWDDYCEDPMAMGRMCQENPACCPLPAGFYWHHVIDQGRCLETEGGEWAVDYVATVEQFDEQMQDIIREIDARRPAGLPPLADVTGPLGRQNEARGASMCSGGEGEDGEELQPEQTRVLVPTKGWVRYSAALLLDRYCDNADYFRGEHQHCMARARHFYSTDFSRLYAQGAAGAQRGEPQPGRQRQMGAAAAVAA